MRTTELRGPYTLDNETINAVVTRISPGYYWLSHAPEGERFEIDRNGRSDSNVNRRLHEHVGDYDQFTFSYATSPKEAYEKECEHFHKYRPPDCDYHPDSPDGEDLPCPYCGKSK
jgi:hypothetical protein